MWLVVMKLKMIEMSIGGGPGGVLQDTASADANWVGRMSVSPRVQWLAGVDND